MNKWLGGIRGAVGMGLIWAAVWAAAGALTRLLDPNRSMDDLWVGPAVGAYPGLVGGLVCSAVIGITAPGRRLAELSASRVAAAGGMAGLLLGLLPLTINEPPSESPLWLVGAVVIGSLTLLGAVTAAGSLALARWAKRREVRGASN